MKTKFSGFSKTKNKQTEQTKKTESHGMLSPHPHTVTIDLSQEFIPFSGDRSPTVLPWPLEALESAAPALMPLFSGHGSSMVHTGGWNNLAAFVWLCVATAHCISCKKNPGLSSSHLHVCLGNRGSTTPIAHSPDPNANAFGQDKALPFGSALMPFHRLLTFLMTITVQRAKGFENISDHRAAG